ncbi:PTS sugar transporter subunit IIA [Rhizobium sp. SSA_523]|uniref:PTS sugar transporter subunit IIA n=1 Tax=Rhizobium sp. SSA_523 TaxID=2952477 RepID=UPI00209142F8|nr:PTS sugar transporter subunit IIA [Rhizobium sp. SSA_523]MCO5734151.1 PTS sugar transporter subunit IIA [Rhizobium sp. SSA_523]WKC21566.1 PTS sugar transporter subunit IIA [Rhizobium sp. SSA_523]
MNTTSFLSKDDIFVQLSLQTSHDVIGRLADHLLARGKVRPSYRGAVEQRELDMPTGLPLEDGLAVAVPHTDPHHVLVSSAAVATLKEPVTFRSMDDPDKELPVRLVFMLALHSKEEQLEMLSAIGGLIQDNKTLQSLCEADDSTQIYTEINRYLKLGG